MRKYIYKITNKINGKCYIGQTKSPQSRHNDHYRDGTKKEVSLLKRAMKKYGKENFVFEVIDFGEDYNELEKKYIKQYRSLATEFGYNILSGGEEPPLRVGEDSNFCNHSVEEVQQIKDLLKHTLYSTKEIAKWYNYNNSGSVVRINNGTIWKDDSIIYPLRDFLKRDIVDNIFDLLQTSKIPQREIAELLGVKRSTVTMINIGANNHRDDIKYPIRKGRHGKKKVNI